VLAQAVPTALVVEDDREWQRILRDEFLSAGFKIDWAWDREEALRKIADPPFEYDVVVLDPNLADGLGRLSGMAIAELIASHAPGAGVVLVSGFASPAVLSVEYAETDATVHGIFEKGAFDLLAFRKLLLDLRGVDHESEALYRYDRSSLLVAWKRVMAQGASVKRGVALEEFAIQFLSGITLLEFVERRVRTQTSEIDAVFRVAAIAGTLCQEWGGHLLVECRNRADKFDARDVRAFAQTLKDADAKVGIVISMAGVTGHGARDGRGEIMRVFLTERRVIIVIDDKDIVDVVEKGGNLYEMLRTRDMAVRLGK
jgi:CheY-like chemotaxis protein